MRRNLFFGIGAELFFLIMAVFGESIIPLLLFFALPVISGISLLCARLFAKNLSVSLFMDDLAESGQVLKGQISVDNTGAFAFPVVRVVTETKNLLTGEVVLDQIPFAVSFKDSVATSFEVKTKHCGRVRLSVQKIKVYDFFGIVSVSVNCTAKEKALILPEMFPMDVTVSKSGAVEPECDTFSPYKAGNDPSETFAIRDYEPGDALRSIHWKLTGKFDRLVIRESSLPVNESVLILFERVCPQDGSFASPEVRHALGEIVVSLSQRLTEMNIAHTVGWLRAENGTFIGHRVDSEESFQLIMAEILSVSEIRGEEDTIESYLKTNDINSYSNIVYIGSRPTEHLSLLPILTSKSVILCSEEETFAESGDHFYGVTPQDYAASLYQMLI